MISNLKSFSKTSLNVATLSAALLSMTGCASYNASSLSHLSNEGIRTTTCHQEEVTITAKAFNKDDCKRYLDRDVIKEGYQPVQLSIQNDSDNSYILSLSRLNLTPANSQEVAKKVHTSTGGRIAAYGAGSLIIAPLIIPAIIDGMKSAEANRQLDADFAAKAIKDSQIYPYSQTNTLIFVPLHEYKNSLKITLLEQKSRDPLSFDVEIAQ